MPCWAAMRVTGRFGARGGVRPSALVLVSGSSFALFSIGMLIFKLRWRSWTLALTSPDCVGLSFGLGVRASVALALVLADQS